jgi:hypothetical protein
MYCTVHDEMLLKYLSGHFGLWRHLILKFLCLFFSLDDLSVDESRFIEFSSYYFVAVYLCF